MFEGPHSPALYECLMRHGLSAERAATQSGYGKKMAGSSREALTSRVTANAEGGFADAGTALDREENNQTPMGMSMSRGRVRVIRSRPLLMLIDGGLA